MGLMMLFNLGLFPIALMIFAFLIPLIYTVKWKKKEFKDIVLLTGCGVIIILFYPVTFYFSNVTGVFGYTIAKGILFVFLPVVTIFHIEKWSIRNILCNTGVRRENLQKSVLYGLVVTPILLLVTVSVSSGYTDDIIWHVVMFFEAFTEDFFFRGILFLYLIQKTSLKVAYSTSLTGFILVHSQHLSSVFIISTITQAVLLTLIVYKTKNIIGAWVAHGLNRNIPSLILAYGIS